MEETKHVSPVDSEKGSPAEVTPRRPSVMGGTDHDLSTGREADFMTRNGLNLKSFQRRELHTHCLRSRGSMNTSFNKTHR